MQGSSDLEARVDRLYSLAPGEFTAARNELAKELGKERADEAKAVSKLSKPSLSASLLNRVRAAKPDAVDDLLAASERVREAYAGLLAGDADAAEVREQDRRQREAIGALVDAAAALAAEKGESFSAKTRTEIEETLEATAPDEEVAALLRRGRLTSPARSQGLVGMEPASDGGARGKGAGKGATTGGKRGAARKRVERERNARDAAAEALETVRAEAEDAERLVEEAEGELARRRRTAERAAREAARAEERLERAEEKFETARQAADGG